jgi:type III secretory pathway component EscU
LLDDTTGATDRCELEGLLELLVVLTMVAVAVTACAGSGRRGLAFSVEHANLVIDRCTSVEGVWNILLEDGVVLGAVSFVGVFVILRLP